MKFVEMFRGSIALSNSQNQKKDFFRHQTLFFLTKVSEWNAFDDMEKGLAKMSLQCIEMPKYDNLNETSNTKDLLKD